jgi:hypothetical protein
MLYGGIEDSKNGNVGPNGDVYFMKMGSSKLTFQLSFQSSNASLSCCWSAWVTVVTCASTAWMLA